MKTIDKYRLGKMVIEGKEYKYDLIIDSKGVNTSWWRKEGHRLHLDDIKAILERQPDVLIIGTGHYGGMEVPEEVIEQINRMGIYLYVDRSQRAVEVYNSMLDYNNIIAAFHLSC